MQPTTIYGICKVTGEMLGNYYHHKYGVDTRSVRFPGIISNVTLPGGGTTDYAVDIFYSAVKGEKFVCPVKAGTFMDMMYMPDAINAAISLMEADPERLKQVLCNVLDNAAKHGGSGKRIIASLRREEDNYVIRIRDFGPGIPPAELPYVKQKFYKGSSKARGSGIGLAVCDEIITRHGGTFEIGNADGGGALVTISLPIPPHTEHR